MLGHISGVVMQQRWLRAVMSCEPAGPSIHACSTVVVVAHVPGGLKAGASTALFIIDRETRLEGRSLGRWILLSRLRPEGFAHVVLNPLREHDPDDAHDLVRQGDNGFVLAASRAE